MHSTINIAGLLFAWKFGFVLPWLAMASFSFMIFGLQMTRFLDKMPMQIGYANWVTSGRLVLILIMGFRYPVVTDWFLFTGFLFVISLDGIDGFLARRYKTSSEIGESLDLETDAFMVLIMSWIHFDTGNLAWWILIPGGLRYYYELVFFWSKSTPDRPSKRVRATIAVAFFLAILTPFVFPYEVSMAIVAVASLFIIISFGISAFYRLKSLVERSVSA